MREFSLAKGIRVTNIFGYHTEGGFTLELKTIGNHTDKLKLDLQFFADDSEDAILPDDFSLDTSTEDIASDDVVDTNETDSVDTEQVEEQPQEETPSEQQEQPQPFLKVKYNKEEMDLDEQTARELAQKGMNFDKSIERARQEARDTFIAELGYEWNGKPITTEADYKQALLEQQWMEQYQNQELPEPVIQELIEGRKFREQFKTQQEQQAEQERKNADFADFYHYFNQVNGRVFDATKDTIPQEVIDLNEQGVPLKFAYMEHHNKELQAKVQRLTQNQTNKQKAPVTGTTAHGSQEIASEDPFLQGFNSID